MKEIILLECVYGYQFAPNNDQITYTHVVDPIPEPQDVLPLFQAIQAKRTEAVKYLISRVQPVDIASHLWTAAEKAQHSANHAEEGGNRQFAKKEWQRCARLFSAAAKAFGATEPQFPWPDWVGCFTEPDSMGSGDMKKV